MIRWRGPGNVFVAGLLYWLLIFCLGFIMGTLRVSTLEPALGRLQAVLVELPVMLLASWLAAHWLLRRHAIHRPREALAMGMAALLLLFVSEVILAYFLDGTSPAQWFTSMARPSGILGLTGQIAFGFMPWLIRSGFFD